MGIKESVVVTGIGVLSPIGASVAELAASLAETRSGIQLVQAAPMKYGYPAGVVRQDPEKQFTSLELVYLDRCQQLAIVAARDAISDAGLDQFDKFGARAGLYYGNVSGGAATAQHCYQQLLCEGKQAPKPFAIMSIMQNGGAAQISIRHAISGPVHTHCSACTSSGTAIGEAARAIRDGYLDIAVAGGAEAPLAAGMFSAFEGARALARADPRDVALSCKPFSMDRSGLVLGEGAAFLVLESGSLARRRGARCLARVAGYGIAADACHIAVPSAEGQAKAIRLALADAALEPAQIDYFNAHGTATRGGDLIEAAAIRSVFGTGSASVPVSSTKALHGHLLGCASALESIVAIIAVTQGILPATAVLHQPDPGCVLNHIANKSLQGQEINRAMSLSCGFGGTNVALVISKHLTLLCHVTHADVGVSGRRIEDTGRKSWDAARREWRGVLPAVMVEVADLVRWLLFFSPACKLLAKRRCCR